MSWIAVLLPALLPLVATLLLQRYFPIGEANGASKFTVEELRQEFRWWFVGYILVFAAISIVLTAIWTAFFAGMAVFNAKMLILREPVIAFLPGNVEYWMWAIPGMFVGLSMATIPTDLVFRKLLGERFQNYLMFERLSQGYNTRHPGMVFIALVVLILAVLLSALMIDSYVLVYEDYIAIDKFWSMREERFPMSSIREIVASEQFVAPNGNIRASWQGIVFFSNGDRWNTSWNMADAPTSELKDMLEYISAQSGQPIEQVNLIDRDMRRSGTNMPAQR